jgi:periplasmic mercuric ion binding protein
MKNLIKVKTALIILAVFAIAFNISETYAGNKKTAVNTPTIQCGTCKRNITNALKKVDGVINVKVDLSTKIVTVKYDDTKTNVGAIEDAISAAGYDANDKKADPVAYENLDECCKVR